MASADLSPTEQGELLQAAAYAEPPIKPKNLALILIIIVLVTAAIATIVIGLRVYVRGWMGRKTKTWGLEEAFAVAGYCAFLSSSIFAIKAAYYGLGTQDVDLNPYLMVRCAEYLLYSQVLYGVSMPLIKASIVLTLVRITMNKWYRYALYAMQFLATVMAMVGILASLLYCRPVKAYWNPLLGTCGDFMIVVNIGYAWTAVGIITDWMCAIIPYFIVRNLQMSRRSKTTVIVILGLGAMASTATIVRAPYLQYYLVDKDRLYWNGHISIWCQIESGLGLIAACLPALRQLVRKYLEASRYGSGAESKPVGYGSRGGTQNKPVDGNVAMDILASRGKTSVVGGKWARLSDDNSSAQHIIQERTISVDTESLGCDDKHSSRS
ncbi:GPCR, PTH11-type [Xylariales sp. AK1849]|nr:GPCR, PTH11-type [Xylariales sp. AK1849]